MTTHFKNGVTNVVGKDGGSSVFSGIKQPLITGGYEQEQAYQNDWQLFNDEDWTITSTGGSDFQLAEYAGGWLRLGDEAPAAGEVTGLIFSRSLDNEGISYGISSKEFSKVTSQENKSIVQTGRCR
mgnify:CR=1 FL=1